MEVTNEDENETDNANDLREYNKEYSISDEAIMLETKLIDDALRKAFQRTTAVSISAVKQSKFETYTCLLCSEEFEVKQEYHKHMGMHLQDSSSDDESQVFRPHTGASSSCDSSNMTANKHKIQMLNYKPHPSADLAHTSVTLLSARTATNNENKEKHAPKAADTFQKSTRVPKAKNGELENQSFDSDDNNRNKIMNEFENRLNSYDVFDNATKAVPTQDKSVTKTRKTTSSSVSQIIKASKDINIQSTIHNKFPTTDNIGPVITEVIVNKLLKYSSGISYYGSAQSGTIIEHVKTPIDEKPYSCVLCNYKSAQKRSLVKHMRTHTGEKPYSCTLCQFKCLESSTLDYHMKTHSGEKPYSCELCDYKSILKSTLLRHMRKHTGERPFSCKLCEYKCSESSNLVCHMRTHTGAKPFSCNLCDYKTARQCRVARHMRTHSGERPYYCELCHSKFTRKCHLKRHMRTHTGEKPFSCKLCNSKFVESRTLKSHMKTHTDVPKFIKRYSCDLCEFKCTNKKILVKHIRSHTSDGP